VLVQEDAGVDVEADFEREGQEVRGFRPLFSVCRRTGHG